MIGSHTLKLVYGAISIEQQIEVHSGKISFRIEVNTAASEPQFVVFIVEPKSAVVTINNQPYSLNNGAMRVVLDPGTYNYSVAAASHHTQNGTFTVAGDKVTKQINLTADAATVTLTTPNGAEIWINEELKGTGRWSGTLTSGTYIFEARKQGHKSTRLSQRITSDTASQSYTLPAPTPIYGSIVVDGTPIAANVTIDGEHIGAMPLKVGNILVGTHTLRVSMAGYKEHVQTISIAEGKTTTVNPTLTKQQTSAPSSASGTYNIGDLVTVNGAQGVVFQTSPVVKIVSVKETTGKWSTEYETTGATDKDNGKANMDKIKSIAGWQTKYPAFKWCADYGNGWYLPALNELRTIYSQRDKINKTLSANNMDKLGSKEGSSWTWSSSEHNNYYMAYHIVFLYGSNNYVSKGNNFAVRAIYVIE